ncbi:MAG: hypothetical protein R3293_08660 [Candidatus Promineifilaceae bacterium]|nr:hypothetical protein [Candidatus Promineifilaceae bacterium]
MKTTKRIVLAALLIFAAAVLAACRTPESGGHEEPYELVENAQTGYNEVVLTEKAAERLGIDTVAISEGGTIEAQTIRGEVADSTAGKVRVSLNKQLLDQVDTNNALVLFDDDDDSDDGLMAELSEGPDDEEDEPGDDDDDEVLFFDINEAGQSLAQGQAVFVKLPMAAGAVKELIVPYSAVIYGLNGETWVYVNTAPLTYMRQEITVEHIDGGDAYLSSGPPAGTAIVTVGVAELFGADTGVGK